MGMLDRMSPARRICAVILMTDCSGSMDGLPISSENEAISGLLPELASMNQDNANAEIQVAIESFGQDVKWETGDEGLVNPETYKWKDLSASGGTPMGEAFSKLNDILCVNGGFMNRASGSVAPVIILTSDGEPTDSYKDGLKKLKNNKWFQVAAKVAIGFGQSNDAVLEEFTGNKETVLHTNNPEELKKLIRFVTITSSMVNSKGKATVHSDNSDVDDEDTTNTVAVALKTAKAELSGEVDPGDKF